MFILTLKTGIMGLGDGYSDLLHAILRFLSGILFIGFGFTFIGAYTYITSPLSPIDQTVLSLMGSVLLILLLFGGMCLLIGLLFCGLSYVQYKHAISR